MGRDCIPFVSVRHSVNICGMNEPVNFSKYWCYRKE